MRRRAGGEPLGLTAKQRLLLGRLLLARPQMVDLDELAHTPRGRLPGHPVNGIHHLVRRKRALLGDCGPAFGLLVSEPGGYRLAVDDVRRRVVSDGDLDAAIDAALTYEGCAIVDPDAPPDLGGRAMSVASLFGNEGPAGRAGARRNGYG